MDYKILLSRIEPYAPKVVYKALQLSNNKARLNEEFLRVYWELVREGQLLTTFRESYNIYYHLSNSISLGGAIAELGVYKGGSAKLISSFSEGLDVHLFDTFEGMPETTNIDHHKGGDFSDCPLQEVKEYLKDFDNSHFHKGFFPESTKPIPEQTEFCFVNLDVDIYQSTLSGLEYFYPRMKKGGIILSHDYNSISCMGVKQAFDEFLEDKTENIIPLWDTQCMLIVS